MARVALVAVLVAAASGIAAAGPTRKVAIDTAPPGATIYIADKEHAPDCDATPCTITLPYGESPIIIELAGYVSDIEVLTVGKPKRGEKATLVAHYDLKKAVGTYVVGGAGPAKGATIKIDGEDKGTAPARIEVEAGSHQVQVIAGKKLLFDDIVNVDGDAEAEITPRPGGVGKGDDDDDGQHEHHERDTPDDALDPATGLRAPVVTAALGLHVGWRHFTYRGAQGLFPFKDGGDTGLGLDVEFWPFERYLGLHQLAKLSLYIHADFYNHPEQLDNAEFHPTVSTYWRTYEVSLRYRYDVMPHFAVEPSLGFADDAYQFNAEAPQLVALPAARYLGLRIGVRLIAPLGPLEIYGNLEDRPLVSAELEYSSFASASSSSQRLGGGVQYRHGRWFGRAELAYNHYNLQLTAKPDAATSANGGTDSVETLTFAVGGGY